MWLQVELVNYKLSYIRNLTVGCVYLKIVRVLKIIPKQMFEGDVGSLNEPIQIYPNLIFRFITVELQIIKKYVKRMKKKKQRENLTIHRKQSII